MTSDPKEREEAENIIGMMDTQEKDIRTKLNAANRDFQMLIGGPVGQLMPPPPSSNSSATMGSGSSTPSTSLAPAAPPGLPPRMSKSAARLDNGQPRRSSVKRQRTMSEPAEEQVIAANLTAEDDMVVEDTNPAEKVAKVCAHLISRQNMLMVTHDGHPACSMMPTRPPPTPSSH